MNEHPLAAAIAAAVAGRDSAGLAAAVTDTVRLRALLLRRPDPGAGPRPRRGLLGGWFDDMDTVELVESAGEEVADRLLIHYRLNLALDDRRWTLTQTSVCNVDDSRLATIDLLCSGYRQIKVA